MRNANITHNAGVSNMTADTTTRVTRALLTCGVVAGIATGSSQAPIVIGFWIGVILTFVWISVMAARLMPEAPTKKA